MIYSTTVPAFFVLSSRKPGFLDLDSQKLTGIASVFQRTPVLVSLADRFVRHHLLTPILDSTPGISSATA